MPALVKIADERVAKIMEERKMPAVTVITEGDESKAEDDEVPETPAA
jgi:hypothetical protein